MSKMTIKIRAHFVQKDVEALQVCARPYRVKFRFNKVALFPESTKDTIKNRPAQLSTRCHQFRIRGIIRGPPLFISYPIMCAICQAQKSPINNRSSGLNSPFIRFTINNKSIRRQYFQSGRRFQGVENKYGAR